MTRKDLLKAVGSFLTVGLLSAVMFAQDPAAARYDNQIQTTVTQKLAKKSQFSDVKSTVEDGIVTLTGTVDLYQRKLDAAKLARKIRNNEMPGLVVGYEDLALDPKMSMQKVCDYLEIDFDPEVLLNPTKVGRSWTGNSAAGVRFTEISTAPVTRWTNELHEDEIGWVEWHCRDLMPEFGYEPRLNRRSLRYFMKPIRGERPKEFLKSRAYSLRDRLKG